MIFHMNSVVYLHYAGQLHNRNTDSKVKVENGKQLFIDIRHEVIFDFATDKTNEKVDEFSCAQANDYDQDTCLIKALDKRMLQTINCTYPTITLNSSHACDSKSISKNQLKELQNFDGKFIFQKSQNINL